MRTTALCLSLAALIAGSSGSALAQTAADAQYQAQQQQYQQQVQAYQARRDEYEEAQARSADERAVYETQRAAYRRARDKYELDHGSGSFVGYYRDHPDEYDHVYGPGAYDRDFGPR